MRVYRTGKPAITHYEVLEQFRSFAVLKLVIETGRTHQIRVHLQNAGHPLVCDEVYGDGQPVLLSHFKKKFNLSTKDEQERALLSRLALHALSISYEGPNDQLIRWEAPLEKDMEVTLKQVRKWSKA
jgi:23S rRNA pseudouridine955/2504/2580 synthase/23S rRNA pseudouridine1911/1915/1917 synthase